ncbi:hypothetical protein [Tropicibacter naphthalenivorans]|uniref:EF hand n=1 Tax=Tropicibacter naphthalenivorans TaxID=441103 RepID=A0A0P1G712_9RHOB|nr:hypothetical protein [Tropicibacter naphthalenivorans]CUH77475.1 EF hand [Tropicibacter naphthalenivorans]SMC57159.1 EF hand [Tropicibacter naphthalenivorans]
MNKFILAAAVSGLALPAFADAHSMDPMDADKDGYVTYEEVIVTDPAFVRSDFDALDVDNSGHLDSAEMIQARENALFPLSENEGI